MFVSLGCGVVLLAFFDLFAYLFVTIDCSNVYVLCCYFVICSF